MRSNAILVGSCSALLVSLGLGCDDVSWPDPEYVESVRILGVRAEPPTLTPGASTELSVYCADGRGGPSEDPTCGLEVAWFAECNNPPGNDPKQCFANYAPWTARLEPSIAETASSAWPKGFGFGSQYRFDAPKTILSGEFQALNQTLRFGNSYVFFAACAGHLVTTSGVSDRLPVECRDRKTGQPLGQRDFTVGYTTIHSYDLVANKNPEFSNPRFDGVAIPTSCAAATPCPNGFECDDTGRCIPVVATCNRDRPETCRQHCLGFQVARNNFGLSTLDGNFLPEPMKSVWVKSFTNAGKLVSEPDFGLKPPPADTDAEYGYCLVWRAPEAPTNHAHLWAVMRDDYGGLTVWDQRIIVQ